MRKSTFLLLLLPLSFIINSCDNDDKVNQISKEGAIETVMNVDHLDQNHDVIITTYNVWIKNELARKIVHRDTVPALGNEIQQLKNEDGEAKSVPLRKEYEIFITVK
jgi:hypothetical protein